MKMPPARVSVPAAVALAAVVAFALLGPCGGDEGAGGGGPGGASTTVAPTKPAESLRAQGMRVTDEVLAGGGPETALGSAQGTVETVNGRAPAIAEILSVEASPAALLLRWRIKSTGPLLDVLVYNFSAIRPAGHFTDGVLLVDPAAQRLAEPAHFLQPTSRRCTCSWGPDTIDGKGQVLTGLYPLLAEDTKQVEVRIPGFPPIPNVAVTKA